MNDRVNSITLRDVADSDLPVFFQQQLDADANWMAAFTRKDPTDNEAFARHWAKIRGDGTILIRTIVVDDNVAGHVASFVQFGDREITYWIGKEYWGRGIATAALRLFLEVVKGRPISGRAAKDNVGSIRVMEKCGFVKCGEEKGFANARGREIEEIVLRLE